MPLTYHIALVCDQDKYNEKIGVRQLTSVCAALQKQIVRDFKPIWQIDATIDPFAKLEDVPIGYWPIVVMNDIDTPGAAGVHEDRMGQPFSLVKAGPLWSLTASHECLEMLVDPFGNRTVAGRLPSAFSGDRSSTVEFLMEVCDPCEDPRFAYDINGIPLSDFYTPDYFAHATVVGARYDMTENLKHPLQVLTNGYLTWHNSADGQWWQVRGFGDNPFVPAPLKDAKLNAGNMRAVIDALTPTPLEYAGLGRGPTGEPGPTEDSCPWCPPQLRALLKNRPITADYDGGGPIGVPEEMVNDARDLQKEIDALTTNAKKPTPPNTPKTPNKKKP